MVKFPCGHYQDLKKKLNFYTLWYRADMAHFRFKNFRSLLLNFTLTARIIKQRESLHMNKYQKRSSSTIALQEICWTSDCYCWPPLIIINENKSLQMDTTVKIRWNLLIRIWREIQHKLHNIKNSIFIFSKFFKCDFWKWYCIAMQFA